MRYRIIVNNKAFNNVKTRIAEIRHVLLLYRGAMKLFYRLNTWFDKRAQNIEDVRFGVLAMYNALQSCVGSIAVMTILQNNAGIFLLGTVTALTMASNSAFIAQGSVKLCLLLFYLSVLINTLIIIFNFR